jgi:hypothetical protein
LLVFIKDGSPTILSSFAVSAAPGKISPIADGSNLSIGKVAQSNFPGARGRGREFHGFSDLRPLLGSCNREMIVRAIGDGSGLPSG